MRKILTEVEIFQPCIWKLKPHLLITNIENVLEMELTVGEIGTQIGCQTMVSSSHLFITVSQLPFIYHCESVSHCHV